MKKILILLMVLTSINQIVLAQEIQLDSIFTQNGLIVGSVKEISPDLIKYSFPNEEVTISIHKNTVGKVRFKSGRIQIFNEAIALEEIKSALDFEKIKITRSEKDIFGLHFLEEFTVTSNGTSRASNVNTVQALAFQKAKMRAALLGGKVIYSLDNTTIGNPNGTKYEVAISINTLIWAYIYTDVYLKISDFKAFMKNRTKLELTKAIYIDSFSTGIEDGKLNEKNIEIDNIYEDDQLIFLTLKGYENEVFRVLSYDENQIILVWKNTSRNRIYNLYLSP
ncbi:MAG: hypothetical protein U5N85_19000 [Arcicella sp.]|nr:hypothetical protein [Arcicella sp.]